MATISKVQTQTGNSRAIVVSWTGLANGDDGEPLKFNQYADKSAQVHGTFGTGGSVRIEGSNDGSVWAPLTDPQGNDLNLATAKIEMVAEATLWIRPRVTAGDGTTSINVHLFIKE